MKYQRYYNVSGIIEIENNPIKIDFYYTNDVPPSFIDLIVYQPTAMSLIMLFKDDKLEVVNIEDSLLTETYMKSIEDYCRYIMREYKNI